MARPTITLSPHQIAEVETLAALLSQDQIADYLGISRATFHALCKREPDVAESYRRGKAKAIAHVANGLLQKARAGDRTAAIFYLKTQAGWRETEAMAHSSEQASPQEDAPEPLDLTRLSDATLMEIVALADARSPEPRALLAVKGPDK